MKRKQPKVLREAGARYRGESLRARRAGSKRVTRFYTVSLRWLPGLGRYAVDIHAAPNVLTAGTASIGGSLRRAREALAHHLDWLSEDGEPLPEDRPPPRRAKGALVETIKVSLPQQ